MPVANEGRQVLQASDNFVVLHRGDQLAQVGYRLVEFGLADEVKRISVFRRDLVGEKLEILSPLFGSQSRKRSFTMSKVGSKEQDAEQFLHKAHPVFSFDGCKCINVSAKESRELTL
jgi:hypothetical protein